MRTLAGGYVYIIIDEFDIKPLVNAPHVALNNDDHDKDDQYDHDQALLSGDVVPIDRNVTYGLTGKDAGKANGSLVITNHRPDLVRFYRARDLKTEALGNTVIIQYYNGVPESDAPTIMLEGIKRTETEKEVLITAVWAGKEAKSESGVYAIDLDVDTFNEKKFGDPANANPSEEDEWEFSDKEVTDKNKLIGKIILPNHHLNKENLPGWVSGFDANDKEARDDSPQIDGKFVPVKVKLEKPYLPDKAEVTFTYDTSHPKDDLKIDAEGDKEALIPITYELKKRGLRLWAKKATEKRDKKSIGEGGDYIKVGEKVKWSKLVEAAGGSASANEITLYLEYAWHPGIAPYEERQKIKVEVEQAEGEHKTPPTWKDEVWVLPLIIEFELKHIEIDPKSNKAVNSGKDSIYRDEIVEIRIKIPPVANVDRKINLSIEPEQMRKELLPSRGEVQMYDFGEIKEDGTVAPDKEEFLLESSKDGEITIKAVFNKEGKIKGV